MYTSRNTVQYLSVFSLFEIGMGFFIWPTLGYISTGQMKDSFQAKEILQSPHLPWPHCDIDIDIRECVYGKYDVPPGSDKCLPSDAVAQWDGGGRLVGGGLGWVEF